MDSLLESEDPDDSALAEDLLSLLLEELSPEAALLSDVSLLPFSTGRLGRP